MTDQLEGLLDHTVFDGSSDVCVFINQQLAQLLHADYRGLAFTVCRQALRPQALRAASTAWCKGDVQRCSCTLSSGAAGQEAWLHLHQ